MLQHLYKEAQSHFELKASVEKKLTLELSAIAGKEAVSRAVAEHAMDYAGGNKAITFDLVHKQLLNCLRARLKGQMIPHSVKAALFLVERLNANIINNYQPARPLQQLLYIYTMAWFQVCVSDSERAVKDSSPGYEILKSLLKLCRRIDQYAGDLARQLCHKLFKLFLDFASHSQDNQSFIQLANQIDQELNGFAENRKKNLLDSIGELRQKQKYLAAKTIIAEKVRETIGDGIYPIVLLDFVENYVTLYLEEYYVEHGGKGDPWRETIKDLSYLIWAFRAEVDQNYRKFFPQKIPPAMERLLTKVEPYVANRMTLYRDFLGLEEILKARYWEEFIKLDSVFNAPYFSAENLFVDQTQKWHSRNGASADWFMVIHKDREIICQLLSKEVIKKKVVFANYSGHILLAYETGEPGFDVNRIQAIPLRPFSDWEYLISNVDYELSNINADFCLQYQEIIKQIDAEAIRRLEQKKKHEAELEFRNQQVQAQLRKEKEERKRQRLLALQREEAERIAEQQRREEIRAIVDKIKIGTQLSVKLENNILADMKLNIITSTTKRYIFNDQNCQHKLAVTKQELIELFVSKLVTVRSFGRGEEYHQTLASVIASRRGQLNKNL